MKNFDKEILSILNGDYIYRGISTKVLHPISILDLVCILKVSYNEVLDHINSLEESGEVKLYAKNIIYLTRIKRDCKDISIE